MDMGSLAALVSSVQTAAELMKGMVGLRDAAMLQNKVIELNGVILSAQSSAFAAQASQFALLQRVRELEAQVAAVEAWNAEKERYQLADVGMGSLAYVLKPEAQSAEPPHAICANCYQKQTKSILQTERRAGLEQLRCHRCDLSLPVKDLPFGVA